MNPVASFPGSLQGVPVPQGNSRGPKDAVVGRVFDRYMAPDDTSVLRDPKKILDLAAQSRGKANDYIQRSL